MGRDVIVDLDSGTVLRRGDRLAVDPDPPFEPAYPGQPEAGTTLWGAAYMNNDDPTARHETPTGGPLEIRRTFSPSWNNRNSCVSYATADIAAGRLPWTSTKVPSWQSIAAGTHDAALDQFLADLDGLGAPVWVTFHHEPEDEIPGQGTEAEHLAMGAHIRDRMTAVGTTNVALSPILMGWTWDPRSGRNPDLYWDDGIFDFIGADPYVCINNASACQDHSILTDMHPTLDIWGEMRGWAEDRGVDLNIAEWGERLGTTGVARMRAMFDEAVGSHADGGGARVSALTYFDSDPANQPDQEWLLESARLAEFHDILIESRGMKA